VQNYVIISEHSTTKEDITMKTIFNGGMGLAKTFWILHVLIGWGGGSLLVLALGFLMASGMGMGLIGAGFVLVFLVPLSIFTVSGWMIFTAISVWKAAGKYTGDSIWVYAAKIFIIIEFINVMLSILDITGN